MSELYVKPETIDPSVGGDTVKEAFIDRVEVNAAQIVADLNTHAAFTTSAHGLKSAAFVTSAYFDTAGLAAAALSSAAALVTTHAALTTSAHGLPASSAAWVSTGYFGSAALVSTGAFDATGLATAALNSSAALVTTHAALTTTAHGLASAAFVTSAYFDLAGAAASALSSSAALVTTHAALTTSAHEIGSSGGGHITLIPMAASSITQGTWAFSINTSAFWNGHYGNGATHNDGDQVDYKTYLHAGSYVIMPIVYKDDFRGIMDILIDGVSIGTYDCYSASAVYNTAFNLSFTVTTPGIKVISVKVNGKNASSSGYYMSFASISIYRTS